jgi:hypothetical protein
VEQCIAFALNSELSLSAENGRSENILLQNVSILCTSDVIIFQYGDIIIDGASNPLISDFSKMQINTKDIRCMG